MASLLRHCCETSGTAVRRRLNVCAEHSRPRQARYSRGQHDPVPHPCPKCDPDASTSGEINAAFATISRERADALFVAPDAFFNSRRVQLVTLATRDRIPTAYSTRDYVEVGGLMSYGTNITDSFSQAGVYAGKILNGAKPAELPVIQSTKFEFVINLQTAKALGFNVPAGLLVAADEVIE
jgi:putative ABC transport system substrate-binding protein